MYHTDSMTEKKHHLLQKNQHRIQSVLAHQEETIKHVPYDI